MKREIKRRCLGLILSLAMLVTTAGPALADTDTIPADRLRAGEEAARELYEMGLMKGIGTAPDGTPVFDLESYVNRDAAITTLVRLLGGEREALSANYTHPFGDSYGWMSPYVGYAYVYSITNGTSAGGEFGEWTFSPGSRIPANQFLTWLLRALGYENVDWISPWALADEAGLSYPDSGGFYRADMAVTALTALDCRTVNGYTLRQRLVGMGILPGDTPPAAVPDVLPDDLPDDPTDSSHDSDDYDDLPDADPADPDRGPLSFLPGPVYDYVTGVSVRSASELPSRLAQAARGHASSIIVSTPSGKASELAGALERSPDALRDMCDAVSLRTRAVDASHFAVELTYSDAAQAMALLEGRLSGSGEKAADLVNEVKGMLSDCGAGDTRDFTVVKAIHDYLVMTTSVYSDAYDYGEDEPENTDGASGPIFYGVGDSEGYARAFELMCYLAGIDCVLIHGRLRTAGGLTPHVWNKVKVDGGWYNIDLYMDDPDGAAGSFVGYDCFLLGDSAMGSTHIPTPDRPLWPASVSDYAVG